MDPDARVLTIASTEFECMSFVGVNGRFRPRIRPRTRMRSRNQPLEISTPHVCVHGMSETNIRTLAQI